MAEVPRHLGGGKGVFPQEKDVVELNVLQLGPPLCKGPYESLGNGGIPAVVHPVSALYDRYRVLGGSQFRFIVC